MKDPKSGAASELQSALRAAHQALKRGDRAEARRMARQATRLAPRSESAWLMLAAASEPRPGLAYAARAAELNPKSETVQKAIRWLVQRASQSSAGPERGDGPLSMHLDLQLAPPETLAIRRLLSAHILLPALLIVVGMAAWIGGQPADAQQPQQASAPLAKASLTPTPTNTPTPTPTFTPTPTPTNTPTPTATSTRVGNISWDYVENPEELAHEGRWINVDLSEQRVTAYDGATAVRDFVVSTGTSRHPTVTGQFRIYVKLRSTPMSGPGYYLPGVPYTMYFYRGYAVHGTYWHNNFGTPMSHGCVNMTIPDSEWIYNFASVGTLVNVHP